MSDDDRIDQTRSYESAAKDIEQEKKMVAALKRLSISNMMSYDPDLPLEDMEYQYQYQQQNEEQSNKSPPTSPQLRKRSSLSRRTSLKGRPSPSDSPEGHQTPDTPFDGQGEPLLDTDTLLWVPANLHPEVDPEQFKIHIKTTVGEIMERKLSRKNSLSRQSSLSSSFLADDKDEQHLNEPETPEKDNANNLEVESYQTKRFSNPSLRDLSFELENLSRLAGMDSTDAVTIARTLSSSSLGYTDVEKQAFDELSSPPHTSPNTSPRRRETGLPQNLSFVDPESPTSHKTVDKLPDGYSSKFQQHQYPQHQARKLNSVPNSPFNSSDFSLKRSRRLDYRKLSNPSTAPGSSLQSNKAGKLAELRNTLNSPTPSQMTHQYHLSNQPQSKPNGRSKRKERNTRDSQLLFSYRNPNVPPDSQSSNDSPYPGSASSSSPIEQQFNTHKFSQHNLTAKRISHIKSHKDKYGLPRQQGYPKSTSRSSSGGSVTHSVHSFEEKTRPRQSPPSQPHSSRTTNKQKITNQYRQHSGNHYRHHAQDQIDLQQKIPQLTKKHVFQIQIPDSNITNDYQQDRNDEARGSRKVIPLIKVSLDSPAQISDNKSKQLNQNLDLLRSEINEFKESLTKMDSPGSKDNHSISDNDVLESSDNNESDFSFEASYQNISYEDSLGIEKDVLKELDSKSSPESEPNKRATEEKKIGPTVSANIPGSYPSKQQDENTIKSDNMNREVSMKEEANKDGIHLFDIDQAPVVEDEVLIGYKDGEHLESNDLKPDTIEPRRSAQKKKSFGMMKQNSSSSSLNTSSSEPKTLKKKKSWPWLKERSASLSSSEGNKLPSLPEAKSPHRSFSTPETPTKNTTEHQQITRELSRTNDVKPTGSVGKENMISKFFKKKRSNSSASSSSDVTSIDHKVVHDSGVTVDYESDSEGKKSNIHGKLKGGIFKKMNKKLYDKEEKEKLQSLKSSSVTSLVSERSGEDYGALDTHQQSAKEEDIIRTSEEVTSKKSEIHHKLRTEMPVEDTKEGYVAVKEDLNKIEENEKEIDKSKDRSGIKSFLESRKEKSQRNSEQKSETVQEPVVDADRMQTDKPAQDKQHEENEVSRSALDVQEKLKKSIKRTSKANQPIEFTDSAFGFPLPPPSQSTLVMLDYRFPVHVERAIYRLSHLKLANPKRSLREQVLLSNFMYAYLNLVDHTLHLEQINNNSDGAPEVVDDTKNMQFASDESLEGDEIELTKSDLESDQVNIDLDIVDLNNFLTTKVEAQ